MRRLNLAAAATFVCAFAVVTVVAFADGGYFRDTWVWTTLALTCLAWVTLVLRDTIALGRLELAGLAALAAYVGWVAFSAIWSPIPDRTFEEAERSLIYVAGVLAGVLVLERGRLRAYFSGLASATAVVVGYAFAERFLDPSTTRDPTQGTLLIEPFGYANALGVFAALGTLLSLGLGLSARSKGERLAWSAGSVVLICGLMETHSRGALLALAAGLFVLAVLSWKRIAHLFAAVRAPMVIGLGVGLALAIAALAFRMEQPLGPRVEYWAVAFDQWRENLWLGSGAGTFALYWLRTESPSTVLDAHSLYVETLAEVGPLGLLLLLSALCVPILAAMSASDEPIAGVGASAYVAYLCHAGLDWDWEMPALTLAGLLCGVGVLAAARREGREITLGTRARSGLALAALVIAGLAIGGSVPS